MVSASLGEVALRAENVDRVIKGIVANKLVMKSNIVSVVKSNSFKESYYRETSEALGGKKGIPRFAQFPQDALNWSKYTASQIKYGLEGEIAYEDEKTDNIDVIARTLNRIGNRVAQMIDTDIWDTISESRSPSVGGIQTIAATATWDNATRASRIPHEDIAKAVAQITKNQLKAYTPDAVILNPTDYIYLATNDYIVGSFDKTAAASIRNGNMGSLFGGLTVYSTPTATTDNALVCQKKVCATYKEVQGLKTVTINEEGIKKTIRAWEMGVTQLTDPSAVCLITNTLT